MGLIINQASVTKNLRSAFDLFYSYPEINLTAIFSPQHGLKGEKQANMIESADFIDEQTGLPIYSLYGKTRIPTKDMLENVDVLVFDLQDIGTRVYTYISTLAYAMQACKKFNKKIIVLDRPNPITGQKVEGNILEPEFSSFVGLFPIPIRHGMTVGELALFFNQEFKINSDLEVIPMQGWKRKMWYDQTGYQWVPPSPNIPTLETAIVYPATVYLEGTNVSEGRGTTKSFEFCGAPFINSQQLIDQLEKENLPGVIFRPVAFQPTFSKWKDEVCYGIQIHVVNRNIFQSVKTGLAIIKAIYYLYPDKFSWRLPPYEYEYQKLPFDILWGTDKIRKQIENNISIEDIEKSWQSDLENFKQKRNNYLLYS
ncbi:MAG: exo-beta-N-acetylmuramidase NamZ domain-containing protein [Candidatus Aminicenantia bacterium]